MQIVGQSDNIELIKSWQSLPQFMIIQGPTNTGKTHLIEYMCELFGVHYVRIKNSVEEIRNLIQNMGIQANTLYHFKDFDRASIQAKNALLKITEEPIINNYICISGLKQLDTLESRAIKLTMSPYTLEDIISFSRDNTELDIELVEKLYNVGIDTPSKILKCKTYPYLKELYDFAVDTYKTITFLTFEDAIRISQMFESSKKDDGFDAITLYITFLLGLIRSSYYKNRKLFLYRCN